jgi:predicted unusual protein kinase regulating ubiquinone biosynthesis (AarF/ABC1/UbiB family)
VSRQCREIIAILDTWGSRFIQELDYLQEAENSRLFAESMQGNAIITKSIVVPRVRSSPPT